MNKYDDLLREKENDDLFNDSSMDEHWAALEKIIDANTKQPQTKYRKLYRNVIAIAAVLLLAIFSYTWLKEKNLQPGKIAVTMGAKSAIKPPLNGANVPYETFTFNAATGDTLFTLNGSVIIFPRNAVLNGRGKIVNGNIEVRTREFNDPFDYSIAGIPMDYDSAETKYQFISSGMIDISAYQNDEPLQVNPGAKPQLNLVSTNKEQKTNLYKLDTVNGKWINKGKDEVNLVRLKDTETYNNQLANQDNGIGEADYLNEAMPEKMPAPPQKASELNPLINITVDPASFKELLVYDGLKFEVTDAKAGTVGEDSKTEWDNIELKRGEKAGTYNVIFSKGKRKAIYNVKPVLEGKDFEAAEILYRQKLKEYAIIQTERKKGELELERDNKKKERDNKRIEKDNKLIEELNKLIAIRNKFIESENIKIDAINKENKRRRDSATIANNDWKQRNGITANEWEQNNRTAALARNLIRSFQIDGFGYWNCDKPTLPQTQQYVSSFKTINGELVTYNTLSIAVEGINRIQNYYNTNNIDLINNASHFGWAFNTNEFYYFTREDFKNAVITNNPNNISISMTLYQGDVKNYNELKGYIFNVNNNRDISKR